MIVQCWPRSALSHPLDAFGFVVPDIENSPVMASTFLNVKWSGRAPDSQALIRMFLNDSAHGGGQSNEALVTMANQTLQSLLGNEAEPLPPATMIRVDRWSVAMPRYHMGHLQRVAQIDALVARESTLAIAGNAYHGVGMPDTIASANRAAAKIAQI